MFKLLIISMMLFACGGEDTTEVTQAAQTTEEAVTTESANAEVTTVNVNAPNKTAEVTTAEVTNAAETTDANSVNNTENTVKEEMDRLQSLKNREVQEMIASHLTENRS